jgi:hypothetical protein
LTRGAEFEGLAEDITPARLSGPMIPTLWSSGMMTVERDNRGSRNFSDCPAVLRRQHGLRIEIAFACSILNSITSDIRSNLFCRQSDVCFSEATIRALGWEIRCPSLTSYGAVLGYLLPGLSLQDRPIFISVEDFEKSQTNAA